MTSKVLGKTSVWHKRLKKPMMVTILEDMSMGDMTGAKIADQSALRGMYLWESVAWERKEIDGHDYFVHYPLIERIISRFRR